MKKLSTILSLLLGSSVGVRAFYIPGVQPLAFRMGDEVPMKVNSMTSIHHPNPQGLLSTSLLLDRDKCIGIPSPTPYWWSCSCLFLWYLYLSVTWSGILLVTTLLLRWRTKKRMKMWIRLVGNWFTPTYSDLHRITQCFSASLSELGFRSSWQPWCVFAYRLCLTQWLEWPSVE